MGESRNILISFAILCLVLLGSRSAMAQEADLGVEWETGDLEYSTPIFPASVIGTDEDDQIEIYYDEEDHALVGRVNGVKAFRFPFDYCLEDADFTPAQPRVLRVFGGPGEDTVTVNIPHSQCPCEFHGGPDNDELQINGCSKGNVHGDKGNDRIVIEEFNESLKVYGDGGDNLIEIRDRSSYIADTRSAS